MATFSFNGVTIVAPGFILRSTIGTQQILQLLPFGRILMVGTSEGGEGGGTVYEFSDIGTARKVLRGGALLDALLLAASVGGASGFVGVVAGAKTQAQLALTAVGGAGSGSAILMAGDYGAWGNKIAIMITSGSSTGCCATFQWPDEYGNVITYGGASTAFDNLANFAALAAAIAADSLLTPPAATGLPPIVFMTVTTNGLPQVTGSFTNLAGGTGTGGTVNATVLSGGAFPITATSCYLSNTTGVKIGTVLWFNNAVTKTVTAVNTATGQITYATGSTVTAGWAVTNIGDSDFVTGLNEIFDEAFDIGHLVNGYSAAVQAYADALSMQAAPLTRLSRWIHQMIPTGTSPTSTRQVNSLALLNGGSGRATALNCPRGSLIVQRANTLSPNTGVAELVDLAPIVCGWAALRGATGENGPATPLTQDIIPNCTSLDYTFLETNNTFLASSFSDLDSALLAGIMPFRNLKPNGQGIQCVQSVTTAPNDATGVPWIYAEFSVQRCVDAIAANIKAGVGGMVPKGLGGGATVQTVGHIITEVIDILDAALNANWITDYNKSAIQISAQSPSNPVDYILTWDMAPVFPLNHLGLAQTVQPFSVTVQAAASATGG